MVGTRADDANLDAVLLVPAGIAVDDVDAIPGVEVVDGTLAVDLPDLFTQTRVSAGTAEGLRQGVHVMDGR